jgi:hypothetical protein
MSTKSKLKRTELQEHLSANGWKEDRWGHYHKNEYRFKFQAITVRLEKKNSLGEWFKVHHDVFLIKNFHLVDGKASFKGER